MLLVIKREREKEKRIVLKRFFIFDFGKIKKNLNKKEKTSEKTPNHFTFKMSLTERKEGNICFIEFKPNGDLVSILYIYEGVPEGLYRVVSGVDDPSKLLKSGQEYYLIFDFAHQLTRRDAKDVHYYISDCLWKSVELVEKRDDPYGYYIG